MNEAKRLADWLNDRAWSEPAYSCHEYEQAAALLLKLEAAVAAERERCAKVCEALSAKAGRIRDATGSLEGDTGYECASAIREAMQQPAPAP